MTGLLATGLDSPSVQSTAAQYVYDICDFLHPHEGKRLTAMLRGYFDESGSHDEHDGVFTVAGYVASPGRWRALTREWVAVLRHAKIDRFHMVDFAHRRGAFTGWSKQQADDTIIELAAIINRRVKFGVSFSISVQDYKNVLVPPDAPRKWEWGKPYLLAMRGCMEALFDNRSRLNLMPNERIGCMFDRNDEWSHKATTHFQLWAKRARWGQIFGPIAFDDADRVIALDTADILAYETHKFVLNIIQYGPDRPIRKLMEALFSQGRLKVHHHNARTLKRMRELYEQDYATLDAEELSSIEADHEALKRQPRPKQSS